MTTAVKSDPRDVFPLFSSSQYHSAAKRIRRAIRDNTVISIKDEEIVENWRASHRHILNAWQVTLKARANDNIVFAQRLKRRNTIYGKLCREPNMSLVRMHDIAGCRLIFRTQDEMITFINNLHAAKKLKHRWRRQYDYMSSPRYYQKRGRRTG